MQTARVRQVDLEVRASGSSVLIARNTVGLSFGAACPIAEMHVTAGDRVQAGGLLAVQGERDELEAAAASAELSVLEAQNTLDSLYENVVDPAALALTPRSWRPARRRCK